MHLPCKFVNSCVAVFIKTKPVMSHVLHHCLPVSCMFLNFSIELVAKGPEKTISIPYISIYVNVKFFQSLPGICFKESPKVASWLLRLKKSSKPPSMATCFSLLFFLQVQPSQHHIISDDFTGGLHELLFPPFSLTFHLCIISVRGQAARFPVLTGKQLIDDQIKKDTMAVQCSVFTIRQDQFGAWYNQWQTSWWSAT